MTSVSNPMITRCPKCGTAFRVTPSQLQSAKGSVRCGSCLNVFKAQDYLVPAAPAPTATKNTDAAPDKAKIEASATAGSTKSVSPKTGQSPTAKPGQIKTTISPSTATSVAIPSPNQSPSPSPSQPHILSAIKPLPVDVPKPSTPIPPPKPAPAPRSVIRTIDKSSFGQTDDILISDDMDGSKTDSKSYEFDGFMDIDLAPKAEVSLFERKIHQKDSDDTATNKADESWAEMLMEDEDENDTGAKLAVLKPRTEEQLADDELFESHAVNTEHENASIAPPAEIKPSAPGLVFSLVGEKEEQADQESNHQGSDDFVLSDELARMPSNQGFNASSAPNTLDPSIFETPDDNADIDKDEPKRQVKTQPKIRSYDGSRTALLMNIIPAPIEFNAKRMRRWYQRKLWPSLSILGLLALVIQVGWFKFDYFSRVEPYRTGYLFLCPYLGCQVPTLVDTSRIVASNLVVREHPDTQGALAVDVMLINGAHFEQPFPDLMLVFTDIDGNQVASRRFIPKDYLGGELVGRELMPQNQKIHITLDLVDPGAEAVNYHISIPRQ